MNSTLDPESIYVALIGDPARMRNLRRIRYRCSDRCLLLDAVAVVDTILIHQKRYKHSDVVNQRRSSPAGRAKNTIDGDNHWKPSTYYIETSALNYPNDRPTPRLGGPVRPRRRHCRWHRPHPERSRLPRRLAGGTLRDHHASRRHAVQ